MKAVVFGGSGFIGSHVADCLSEKDLAVTVYDIQESPFIRDDQKMIIGDLNDVDLINKTVENADYVLNFAGVAGLDRARNEPLQACQANIVGNLNILEAIKSHSIKRYIFASSYYVYSQFGSIYRVTKQSCELFIEEYARLYDLPFTILRYGSLYGPRASEENGVKTFLKQAIHEGKISRLGDGEEIREYIHSQDAAKSTFDVMMKDQYRNQYVILAGSQQTKIKDLLAMVKEMMGEKIEIEYKENDSKANDHYKITPYTFRPQTAVRYIREDYHDLGQGLLQMLYELNDQKDNH